MGVEMSMLAARFLNFLLFFTAFAPLTAFAAEKTVYLSVTVASQPVMAHAEGKMIHPSDFAEWGLLLADVLLGAVAIFLIFAGFVSYSFLNSGAKEEAQKTAEVTAREEAQKIAKEKIQEYLKESNIKQMLMEAVSKETDALVGKQDSQTNEKGEGK